MSSIFGWDYPPGCHSVPGDEPDPPCDVCGGFPDFYSKKPERPGYMKCICPECPVCGEYGNPKCYKEHGLVITDEQKNRLKINQDAWKADEQAEAEMYAKIAEDEEKLDEQYEN